MSHIEIVDRFEQDGFFVVLGHHFLGNGEFWYSEHYRWGGNEGLKRKRQRGPLGGILMDNSEEAPEREIIPNHFQEFLPNGRTWYYRPGPHMDEGSIWDILILDHNQRHAREDEPTGTTHILARQTLPARLAVDCELGCAVLLTRFADIVNDAVVIE